MATSTETNSIHRKFCARLLAFVLTLFVTDTLSAQLPLPLLPTGGSSSRSKRKNAMASIPYGSLTPEAAKRIRAVVNKPTIYRRLPIKTIDSDPELFLFLIRNPEVVVDIWQQMGVTQLTIDRVGDYQFKTSDGAGTDSQVDLVYGTPKLHIYYGAGAYEGPLFKQKINGQCVMILQSDYHMVDGRSQVRNQLDVFLNIDQGAIDLVAKTISPLFGRSADINFTETSGFLSKFSQAAESNGTRMQDIAMRMRSVSPPVKEKFVQVASSVKARSQATANAATSGPRKHRMARPPANRHPGSIRPASATTRQRGGHRAPLLDSRIEMPVLR